MKILLLSDAPMALQGGIGQTLYNIFSFCSPEDLLCIAPRKEIKNYPPSPPYNTCYVGYISDFISLPGNRFTAKLQKVLDWINLTILSLRQHRGLRRQIEQFNPDVVISCPNGITGVVMHRKLLQNSRYKVLPYFMDDWMYRSKAKWINGNVQGAIKEMLKSNLNWLMIGDELAEVLKERYKVQPRSVLNIRNPVDLSNAPPPRPLNSKSVYTIAYAGALWPMHFDSFLIMAKAIQKINNTQLKIRFVIYTGENYWNWRKSDLEPLDVVYGGSIAYDQIHQKLSEADLLLVTSSFSPDLFTHAKASVQTKLTDYLKARRLVVSYGPSYSANHHFLQQHNCGICISSTNENDVSNEVKKILDAIEHYQYMIDNGWQTLKNGFTFEVVHKKLREFIQEP